MGNPWLHRYAIFAAACTLLLLGSGALVTSGEAEAAPILIPESLHTTAAAGVGVLLAVLALWLALGQSQRWLRWQGLIAAAIFIADLLEGTHANLPRPTPEMGVFHAVLAQLLFAILAEISLVTSPRWSGTPDVAYDSRGATLRWLGAAMPFLVLLQVALGAGYRHKILSVMPHMAGAMLALLLVLGVSIVVMQNHPAHRALFRAAAWLMGIVLAQVTLGIAVFIMELLNVENTNLLAWITAGHGSTGALTLAASLLAAIEIRRNIHPSAAQPAGSSEAPLATGPRS